MSNGESRLGTLGQGTRVTKSQNETSELWIYPKQAIMGSAALDGALFLLVVMLLCIGWPSLLLALAGLVALTKWITKLAIPDILARRRVFRAFVISYVITFLAFAPSWWNLLIGRAYLLPILGAITRPIFTFPKWGYGLILCVWFYAHLKGHGVATLFFLFGAMFLYVAYSLPAINWAPLVTRLRYLVPMFLVAPILFSLVLSVAMFKEILLPNFDIMLVPLKFSEALDILRARWRKVSPEPRLRIERISNGGRTLEQYTIPRSQQAIEFYQAALDGASFTHQTAKMGRVRFNRLIRDPFLEKDLIEWVRPGADTQGVRLTDEGRQELEKAVAGEYLPEWEDDYTPSPTD